MTPARGTSDRLRDYCPTRPGRSTFVNSTAPSCSRSRTVISALSTRGPVRVDVVDTDLR